MDVQDELRQLEKRRQAYLSTVQDPSTTRVEREEALGDLQLTEAKIAELGKLSRLSGKWLSADFQFPEIPAGSTGRCNTI